MRHWLVLLLLATPALADPAPRPPQSLSYENLFCIRINPLGVGDEFKLRYRIPLYGSANPLLAQNFFGLALPIGLAPSFIRPGLGVEVQPLSLLHFYVGYEPAAYFGALGSLRSYPSATSDYGFGAFTVGGPPYPTYASVVHQLVLSTTLQFAWRWFAFRSLWRAEYVDANTHNGDSVFYDPLYALLLPQQGWMLYSETDAVYRSKFGLTAGIRYSLTLTWYPDSAFAPGETPVNLNSPIQKLGPLVAYTFFEGKYRRFDAPTIFLVVNWYLQDRYRTGQLVNQALPMVGIGFSFRGTLFETARR
jgi:hypothetical protein